MFKFTKIIKHFKNNTHFKANIKLFFTTSALRLQMFYSEWKNCNYVNTSIIAWSEVWFQGAYMQEEKGKN